MGDMIDEVEIEVEEDEEEEDYGYYDDDDDDDDDDGDTSWQLRRGALKLINAILESFQSQIASLYISLGEDLLARFKEREELVRADVINCYKCLLRLINDLRG